MGDRVMRPAVAGIACDGFVSALFSTGIVAALLKTEGMHTKQGVVAGVGPRPGGETARHAVMQIARVAAVEVIEVRGLQCDDVVWPEQQNIF